MRPAPFNKNSLTKIDELKNTVYKTEDNEILLKVDMHV